MSVNYQKKDTLLESTVNKWEYTVLKEPCSSSRRERQPRSVSVCARISMTCGVERGLWHGCSNAVF
jgi:hypothetical protein